MRDGRERRVFQRAQRGRHHGRHRHHRGKRHDGRDYAAHGAVHRRKPRKEDSDPDIAVQHHHPRLCGPEREGAHRPGRKRD